MKYFIALMNKKKLHISFPCYPQPYNRPDDELQNVVAIFDAMPGNILLVKAVAPRIP